jgi:hypothetical protein
MKLSDDWIHVIRVRVEEGDITTKTLKDDVIDHICCLVERKMAAGKVFEIALNESLFEVAPNGLDDLQRKTFILLRSPKIIFMKKVMYSIGLITAVLVSLGWLFTTLRWPGGRELFNYGFLGFLLIFIPMVAIERYRTALRKTVAEKLRIVFGSVSGFIVGLSLVFKLLHLQGADVLLIGGMLMFTFCFLPALFFNMYKKASA